MLLLDMTPTDMMATRVYYAGPICTRFRAVFL
jgi:hypothetical protein